MPERIAFALVSLLLVPLVAGCGHGFSFRPVALQDMSTQRRDPDPTRPLVELPPVVAETAPEPKFEKPSLILRTTEFVEKIVALLLTTLAGGIPGIGFNF